MSYKQRETESTPAQHTCMHCDMSAAARTAAQRTRTEAQRTWMMKRRSPSALLASCARTMRPRRQPDRWWLRMGTRYSTTSPGARFLRSSGYITFALRRCATLRGQRAAGSVRQLRCSVVGVEERRPMIFCWPEARVKNKRIATCRQRLCELPPAAAPHTQRSCAGKQDRTPT